MDSILQSGGGLIRETKLPMQPTVTWAKNAGGSLCARGGGVIAGFHGTSTSLVYIICSYNIYKAIISYQFHLPCTSMLTGMEVHKQGFVQLNWIMPNNIIKLRSYYTPVKVHDYSYICDHNRDNIDIIIILLSYTLISSKLVFKKAIKIILQWLASYIR